MSEAQIVKINAIVIKDTPGAYLIESDGDQAWFPKSQITVNTKTQKAEVPTWLLDKKGWCY